MMKSETVKKDIERIENTLDRLERGLYTGLSISWVTDRITWLYKYHYIDYYRMAKLTTKACEVLENTFKFK